MTASELKKATTSIALLALILTLAVITPFGLLVGVIWGLVAFCWDYTRRIKQQARPEHLRDGAGLRYNLCAFGLLYLIPIGVATTFYCLLAVYLQLFGNSASIGWLISLQQAFEAISKFFSDYLKLSEFAVFAVLIGVYLLTCLLLSKRRSRGRGDAGHGWRFRVASALNRGTEFYTKYSGPAAAGLATLASFTVFGMQLGVPATDLELRLKVAQHGYAEVTKKIEADLSQRVARGLYDKVYAGFPQSYRDVLTEQATIGGLVDGVRGHAANAKSTYDVSVPSIDRAVQDETAKRLQVDALAPDLRVESIGRTDTRGDATPEQVKAARTAVADPADGQGIDLVTDGRRKVTLQVERIVSERILALTKPLTDAVPIMEPLLQAFAEAIDKTLQDRVGKAYDRLVEVAIRSPHNLDAAVGREAQAIVNQTDVSKPVVQAAPRAQRLAETRRLTLSSLHAGKNLIDQKVTETLATRQPPQTRPGRPLDLPKLYLRPLPPLPPYSHYGTPGFGGYDRPPNTYRIPPRTVQPPRAVRPPPRIFFW
jgi:hypothetical protein